MKAAYLLRLLLGLMLFTGVGKLNAQADTELLQAKLIQYNKANPRQTLFVQTDKTIYTNNETIWFAGYVLETTDSLPPSTVITASLIEETSLEAVLQKKYMVLDGLCKGSIQLPDTLVAGTYRLIFTTNVLTADNKPLGYYEVPLSLKSTLQKTFLTSFTVNAPAGDSVYIDVAVKLPQLTYVKDAIVKYNFKGERPRQLKLPGNGKGTIAIPKNRLSGNDIALYTTTTYEKKTQPYTVWLSGDTLIKEKEIRFFPEGGELIMGAEGRVMLELKEQGMPIAATVHLLTDGTVTDTLTTNWDGIGSFRLNALPGKQYAVATADGKLFPVPVKTEGVGMELSEGVVEDTLYVVLRSPNATQVKIALHNQTSGFVSPLIKLNGTRKIMIPLEDTDRGLTTVTILNEQNLPLAERLFYAHYTRKEFLTTTLPEEAIVRKEVEATISLADQNGNPITGVVTVSCVRTNRVDPMQVMDIVSYHQLYQHLVNVPKDKNGSRIIDNRPALEQALLVQGWRRFRWDSLQNTNNVQPTIMVWDSIPVQAVNGGKEYKKEMEIVTLKEEALSVIQANKQGQFSLSVTDLLIPELRRIIMRPTGKEHVKTGFLFTDILQERLADFLEKKAWVTNPTIETGQGTMAQQLGGDEKYKAMEEVVVKANKNLYGASATDPVNLCGDYLCHNNILNCFNHGPHSAPVKGRSYRTGSGSMQVYQGCLVEEESGVSSVVPEKYVINISRDFYGMETIIPVQEAEEFMSTIYWNAFLLLENGKGKVSFYTSDLEGEFILKIQGISSTGETIYTEKVLTVKK